MSPGRHTHDNIDDQILLSLTLPLLRLGQDYKSAERFCYRRDLSLSGTGI